jgi:hypothetical protein
MGWSSVGVMSLLVDHPPHPATAAIGVLQAGLDELAASSL